MRVSLAPITPQDLRDDARNAARLAEIARDAPSRDTLLALSRKFLAQAERLEAEMRNAPAGQIADGSAKIRSAFGTPKYWRDRAAEARSMLDQLTAPEARQAMALVVENYERLTRLAEGKEGRDVGAHENL